MFRSLEARSPDKAGVNEDICFHSGSAGTCSLLPQLSETISRHLLTADCSGRFLMLLWPSTPPSGLGKVLHRSPRCVAHATARSGSEREKSITSCRAECDLFLYVLCENLIFVSGRESDQYIGRISVPATWAMFFFVFICLSIFFFFCTTYKLKKDESLHLIERDFIQMKRCPSMAELCPRAHTS